MGKTQGPTGLLWGEEENDSGVRLEFLWSSDPVSSSLEIRKDGLVGRCSGGECSCTVMQSS